MKLKKGDTVKILLGKDRGRIGKIERVLRKKGLVVVGGVNIYKKHLKKRGENQPGGIVEISKPLPVAKVALVCPECDRATRVGYKIVRGKKIRICKKCRKPV